MVQKYAIVPIDNTKTNECSQVNIGIPDLDNSNCDVILYAKKDFNVKTNKPRLVIGICHHVFLYVKHKIKYVTSNNPPKI